MKKLLVLTLIAATLMCVACSKHEEDVEWNTFEYTVYQGETLWEIAEEYCPEDMDKRDYIEEIKELNNMDTYALDAWQEITLLTTEKCTIDMYDIVNIEQSDNGYLITLEDGNGYYWERGMN